MKQLRKNFIGRMAMVCASLLTVGVLVNQSQAQVTLHDANSTAVIDPNSQAGMYHWDIQGLNQLQQQWFWYGTGTNATRSIDTISAASVTPIGANEAKISYANASFNVTVDYVLTGGSSAPAGQHANADIGESIKIVNTSGAILPFHFYQYSYFNLYGASSDSVQLGQNIHGLLNEAFQSSGGGNPALTETVTTPGANHGEVAPLGATLAKLNGAGAVTLGAPFFNGPIGPGAVTWALQWDFNIAPGGSAIISKDKYLDIVVAPEPSALALIGVGLVGLGFRKRRATV